MKKHSGKGITPKKDVDITISEIREISLQKSTQTKNRKNKRPITPKIEEDTAYFFISYNPGQQQWMPTYVTTDHRYPFATSWDLFCFAKVTEPICKFWRQNVLDRLFPNNSNADTCDLSTVRLIKANIVYEDITHELMPDAEETEERRRNATLARLTPEEARLLNVETEYAMMLMTRKEPKDWDEKLAGKVVSRAKLTIPTTLQRLADKR